MANLLCFAHQAGLYRARPRDRADEQQLSRPAGDDPVREEKKALWALPLAQRKGEASLR